MSHLPGIAPSKVMRFEEVQEKSKCQPMEQLVDVEDGLPVEAEYIYRPACVTLKRCSGCCGDERMECQPTLERNITLPVLKIIHAVMPAEHVQVTFVEHQSCECRLRQHLQNDKNSTESITERPRKRKHTKTTNDCEKCQFPQNKINHH